MGLVNPGIVNVMGWPEVKVPAVNETVKTKGPDPLSAAVPAAPAAGAVKVRVPAPVSAIPAPMSVIRSLPLLGTVVTGVSVTLMVTDVAPLATLLRVIAGCGNPRELSTMAPVEIMPAEQEFSEVTTAKVLDAGTAVALSVRPDKVTVCEPAAVVGPLYVMSIKLMLGFVGVGVAGPVGVKTVASTPALAMDKKLHVARPDAPNE